VLIVLITIAAVTILWQVIIPMVRQSSDVGFACEKARMDLELISAKYFDSPSPTAGSFEFQVKRGDRNADIDDLRIYLYNDEGKIISGEDVVVTLEKFSPSELPSSNNVRTFSISKEGDWGAVMGWVTPKTISIAPVVNGEVCDKLEPIDVEVIPYTP